MPGIRVSGGKYLEILEPAALVDLPIEVDIYDGGNPATMLATIEAAIDPSLQVQLSDVGAGRFELARSDPKATDAILAKGNLVKLKTGGKYRGGFWIEEPVETLTSTQEALGERWRIAGRGMLAYLERAVVYPPVWPTQSVSFVASSSANNTDPGETTVICSKPAGVVTGDVMIAAVSFVGGSSKSLTAPTGWREFRRTNEGTIGVALFRKQAGASEGSSYKWVFTTSTKASVAIVALRNAQVDYTTYGFDDLSAGSGTSIRHPSLSIDVAYGALLTIAVAAGGTNITPPATYTEAEDRGYTGNALRTEVAYLLAPALGDTGEQTSTNTTSATWIGLHLHIPSTATNDQAFDTSNPGEIMSTLIDRAQLRGALGDLTYDFTVEADSAGQPWTTEHTLTFHAGTTLLDVFRQLSALGVEGEMTHDLRFSMYVDRSRDKTADVILRKGYHLLGNVANVSHLSGIRTRLLVEGAGGRMIEVGPSSLETTPRIGRREGFLSMATSDTATDLAGAGAKALELAELEDQARSVPVAHGLRTAGHYEPWEDYRPGDYISLDAAGTGELTTERVIGITIEGPTERPCRA